MAPKVDGPHVFAVQNDSGAPMTVSFSIDMTAHIMTGVIGEWRPARRAPDRASISGDGDGHSSGDQPV